MYLINHENEGVEMNLLSPHPNLLGLPILILDGILDCLDKSGLINFRAVCRKTKELAEQPRYIDKLEIRVRYSTARLEEMENSAVKWSNLTTCDDPKQNYLPYLKYSREFLTRIKIEDMFIDVTRILVILKNVGPQLRYFTCIGWLMANPANYQFVVGGSPQPLALQAECNEMKHYLELSHNILQQNLIGLQHITLGNDRGFAGTSFCLLATLLTCCPNLRTIGVPPIDSTDIIRNQNAELTCMPILDYLRRRLTRGRRQPLLRIDLCHRPIWNSLFRYTPIGSLFPLTPSILIELTSLCQQTGVKLYNVPSSALPPSDNLTQSQKESINKSVASVLCANVTTGITTNIYIPPNCPVQIVSPTTGRTEPDLSNFQLPDSINLVSIICAARNAKPLYRILVQRVWRTVTELQILGPVDVWTAQSGPQVKLASVFPNLKKLRLGSISTEQVFHFLSDLRSLEMLRLRSVTGSLDMDAISNWFLKMNVSGTCMQSMSTSKYRNGEVRSNNDRFKEVLLPLEIPSVYDTKTKPIMHKINEHRTTNDELKYFELGGTWDDPSVTLKAPGYFGTTNWFEDP